MHAYFKKLITYPKALDIIVDCGSEGTKIVILQQDSDKEWFLGDGVEFCLYLNDDDIVVHDHTESDDGSYIVFEIDGLTFKLEVREPAVVIKGFFSEQS